MAKNNKQSKQKKSVLNKLGGLSKRSKFIVVVLIFAVLGGGYLTYKSFAATAAPASIRQEAAYLRFSGGKGCNKKLVPEPAKNNQVVMQIYCPPGGYFTVSSNGSLIPSVKWPRGSYKNCIVAKGVGKFNVGQFFYQGERQTLAEGIYNINSPDYKTYCSNAVTIGSDGIDYFQADYAQMYMNNYRVANNAVSDTTTLMTISSITRYWYAPGVAPAPSGGK